MVPKLILPFLLFLSCFRAVLFRMVPKHLEITKKNSSSFRAVLFRMVPKLTIKTKACTVSFRAVLFRMVPKPFRILFVLLLCFRAVLFRMVPKLATKYEYTKTPPSSSLGGVIYVGHRFVMS